MSSPRRRNDWRRAQSLGFRAGLVAMVGMWVLAALRGEAVVSAPPVTAPVRFLTFLAGFLVFNVVGPVLTVGTPVALYLRYGVVTPLVVVVVSVLLVTGAASGGDVPGYYVALALFWPVSVVLAVVSGFGERFVREQALADGAPDA